MKKKTIQALTPEQIAQQAVYRDNWIKIGLSTEPADRPRAERAIRLTYEAAGLSHPKIVWCGSPLSQGLTRAILLNNKNDIGRSVRASVRDSVWASVRDSVWAGVGDSVWAGVGDSVWAGVWASVRDNVWAGVWASVRASVWAGVGDSVGDSVWASVRDSVRDSVGDSVWASVGDSVWANVWDNVWDNVRASVWASVRNSVWTSVGDSVGASVRDSVRDSVGDSVGDNVGDSGYGQHDASWIGFYAYFRDVCGLQEETDKLRGLTELAQSAGWFLPHANICWVAERHNVLSRDEQGRLHSLTGPAVAYPDGWSIYAVHGVRVPADVIEEPESVTVARIEKEENAEVRRVMIERMGYERYLLESGAQLIHSDECGALYRKEIPDDEPVVAVHVLNATPEADGSSKRYMIRVPPTMTRAREAVAWTFNVPEHAYRPAIET